MFILPVSGMPLAVGGGRLQIFPRWGSVEEDPEDGCSAEIAPAWLFFAGLPRPQLWRILPEVPTIIAFVFNVWFKQLWCLLNSHFLFHVSPLTGLRTTSSYKMERHSFAITVDPKSAEGFLFWFPTNILPSRTQMWDHLPHRDDLPVLSDLQDRWQLLLEG